MSDRIFREVAIEIEENGQVEQLQRCRGDDKEDQHSSVDSDVNWDLSYSG